MPRHDPDRLLPSSYAHRVDMPTRFADLDELGHINNLATASALEDGRTRFFMEWDIWLSPRDRPSSYSSFFALVVASLNIDFLSEAHYPEALTVYNAITRIGSKSFSTRQLVTQADKPTALCDAVFVHVQDGRSAVIPDDLRLALERASQSGL